MSGQSQTTTSASGFDEVSPVSFAGGGGIRRAW